MRFIDPIIYRSVTSGLPVDENTPEGQRLKAVLHEVLVELDAQSENADECVDLALFFEAMLAIGPQWFTAEQEGPAQFVGRWLKKERDAARLKQETADLAPEGPGPE